MAEAVQKPVWRPPLLTKVTFEQGRLLGKMEGLGFEEQRDEAHLDAMTDEVVKSSEIEGEALPQESSLRGAAGRAESGFPAISSHSN